MINKNLFIQNIKDCTTVLQELRVCIDEVKNVIDAVNNIKTYNIMLGIGSTNALLMFEIISSDNIEYATNYVFLRDYLLKLPRGHYSAFGTLKSATAYQNACIQRLYVNTDNYIQLEGYYINSNGTMTLFTSPEITLSNYQDYFGSPINIQISSH